MRIGAAIFLVTGLMEGACTLGAWFTLIGQGAAVGLLIGLAIKVTLFSALPHDGTQFRLASSGVDLVSAS